MGYMGARDASPLIKWRNYFISALIWMNAPQLGKVLR